MAGVGVLKRWEKGELRAGGGDYATRLYMSQSQKC